MLETSILHQGGFQNTPRFSIQLQTKVNVTQIRPGYWTKNEMIPASSFQPELGSRPKRHDWPLSLSQGQLCCCHSSTSEMWFWTFQLRQFLANPQRSQMSVNQTCLVLPLACFLVLWLRAFSTRYMSESRWAKLSLDPFGLWPQDWGVCYN